MKKKRFTEEQIAYALRQPAPGNTRDVASGCEGLRTAGDATRTRNIQLGRLDAHDSKVLETQAVTNSGDSVYTPVSTGDPKNGQSGDDLDADNALSNNSAPTIDAGALGRATTASTDWLETMVALVQELPPSERARLIRRLGRL